MKNAGYLKIIINVCIIYRNTENYNGGQVTQKQKTACVVSMLLFLFGIFIQSVSIIIPKYKTVSMNIPHLLNLSDHCMIRNRLKYIY